MGVDKFEDLEAWQLADELRQYVFDLTRTGAASRDLKFREQIEDAADSGCDNIAEGFGRYGHVEFVRFLTIALSSILEVKSKLISGVHRRYFSVEESRIGRERAEHAKAAIQGLMRYLRSSEAPPPFSGNKPRPKRAS